MKNLILILLLILLIPLLLPVLTLAGDVTVGWDHNDPLPDGYRVFLRYDGDGYDYAAPAWEGSANLSDPIPVLNNRLFYLVVRAYAGPYESADSEEVGHMIVTPPAGVSVVILPRSQ